LLSDAEGSSSHVAPIYLSWLFLGRLIVQLPMPELDQRWVLDQSQTSPKSNSLSKDKYTLGAQYQVSAQSSLSDSLA
jgi:hypothetical protein